MFGQGNFIQQSGPTLAQLMDPNYYGAGPDAGVLDFADPFEQQAYQSLQAYVPPPESFYTGELTNAAAGPTPYVPYDADDNARRAALAQEYANRGVRYQFGARDPNAGAVDCSGYICTLNPDNQAVQRGQTAAGIIQELERQSGQLYTGDQLAPGSVQPGMFIGLDSGPKSWDGDRYLGIDHIAQLVQDPNTGQLMVAESTGRGIGVRYVPYAEWYDAQQRVGGRTLYGAM